MSYGDYPDLQNVKKILVIKMRQLGDTLLTTPVFSALKKKLPKARVDAYIYSEAKELLEDNPFVDQLICYDKKVKAKGFFKKILYEWSLLKKIRHEQYDLVINLTEGDRGAIASWMAGASIRVGFVPKGKWQKKLITHTVKSPSTPRHTVEKNLDALRRIGIFPKLDERQLYLSTQEVSFSLPDSYILIHPTSRWRFKCWPASKMRALSQKLIERGEQLVFTSGPDKIETEMIDEITQGLDVINLSGKLSLLELAGVVQKATVLVCVDSLIFHMASALKAPVVALFGPTSDINWGPWQNPMARVLSEKISCRPCFMDGCGGSKMSDCLYTLSVERVLKEIDGVKRVSTK